MGRPRASLAELLNRAHAVLLGDLEKLEETARSPTTGRSARFAAHLRRVQRHLIDHFRFEERNGYMSAVRKREPQLDQEVNRLLQEHRQLAQALNALIEQAGQSRGGVPAEQVQAWIAQVRFHESRENALIEEVFNRDIIAAD